MRFAHASVQTIADRVGADVLHIKGVTVDPDLNPGRSAGTDADIIVRPSDVPRLMEGLTGHGWTLWCEFHEGSAFDHAASLHHRAFGMLDVHQNFPGLHRDPAASFETLWRDRRTVDLAGRSCAAPGPVGEHLILLLHAARSPGKTVDVKNHWTELPPAERDELRRTADGLGAGLGLDMAIEGPALLDTLQGPEADLWRVMLGQADQLTMWRARWGLASGVRAKARLVGRAGRVNRFVLGERLGRVPTREDVRREWWSRAGQGVSAVGRRTGRVLVRAVGAARRGVQR